MAPTIKVYGPNERIPDRKNVDVVAITRRSFSFRRLFVKGRPTFVTLQRVTIPRDHPDSITSSKTYKVYCKNLKTIGLYAYSPEDAEWVQGWELFLRYYGDDGSVVDLNDRNWMEYRWKAWDGEGIYRGEWKREKKDESWNEKDGSWTEKGRSWDARFVDDDAEELLEKASKEDGSAKKAKKSGVRRLLGAFCF
ncbi:hypothetical protein LTR09_003289 [Extremus antarcticus]|uniref:Uncharacterized protein n=1 Tax=Extremus antarcticus TaxID=702011 RepID=A0AAJ0LUH2_9PEZI|nr:hypothetical protein LTR09_003289 [Extremus antarcticus]